MAPPPSNVILPPPLISTECWKGKYACVLKLMVCGLAPQLKDMLPPPYMAFFNEVSVQLAAVPLPTTAALEILEIDDAV